MFQILALQTIFPSGLNERCEERMRIKRFGLVFGVELARDKIRMSFARQLDHFHEFAVGRNAAEYKPFLFECSAEFGIELVTMTMPFADVFRAVINIASEGRFFQVAIPRS